MRIAFPPLSKFIMGVPACISTGPTPDTSLRSTKFITQQPARPSALKVKFTDTSERKFHIIDRKMKFKEKKVCITLLATLEPHCSVDSCICACDIRHAANLACLVSCRRRGTTDILRTRILVPMCYRVTVT